MFGLGFLGVEEGQDNNTAVVSQGIYTKNNDIFYEAPYTMYAYDDVGVYSISAW
jgi:hypothetical protein